MSNYIWDAVKNAWNWVWDKLDWDERTPVPGYSNRKLVYDKIINTATGRELKGEFYGYNPEGTKVKIGSRWYPAHQIQVEAHYESDSELWTG